MDYDERWPEHGETGTLTHCQGSAEGGIATGPSKSPSRGTPRGTEDEDASEDRMPVFTAASPATAKWWEQPECPSTDEWINECSVYVQCSIIQPYKKKKVAFSSDTRYDMDEQEKHHTK